MENINLGDYLIVNCLGSDSIWIAKVKQKEGKVLVSEYEDFSINIFCDVLKMKTYGVKLDEVKKDINLVIYIPNLRFYNILTEKDSKLIDIFELHLSD
jgi:hypothetical protein